LDDLRNIDESSRNPGNRMDQRVQSLMFMMIVMNKKNEIGRESNTLDKIIACVFYNAV
jgi:hypothetical protein